LRSSAVRTGFRYFSYSRRPFPDFVPDRYSRPSQSVGFRHLIRSSQGTQTIFGPPQAATICAANSFESERRAGSDQGAEGGGPAPDSVSEGVESEEEELLLLR
jgi:hypothetical protein